MLSYRDNRCEYIVVSILGMIWRQRNAYMAATSLCYLSLNCLNSIAVVFPKRGRSVFQHCGMWRIDASPPWICFRIRWSAMLSICQFNNCGVNQTIVIDLLRSKTMPKVTWTQRRRRWEFTSSSADPNLEPAARIWGISMENGYCPQMFFLHFQTFISVITLQTLPILIGSNVCIL